MSKIVLKQEGGVLFATATVTANIALEQMYRATAALHQALDHGNHLDCHVDGDQTGSPLVCSLVMNRHVPSNNVDLAVMLAILSPLGIETIDCTNLRPVH